MDSNHDEENQNPMSPRRKFKQSKHIPTLDDGGRTTGRTQQKGEGGIPDAGLAALVTAWPTLPEPIRAAIRAMVGTVAGPS